MSRSLKKVLENPDVYRNLQDHPGTFRFSQGPSLVVSGLEWKPHLVVSKAPDGHLIVQGPVANLLNMVASSLNFTYHVVTPEDQFYGSKLPNGSWTGMVGQVFRKEVDIALGPFAHTVERGKDVDYTGSFFFDGRTLMTGKGRLEIDPWGFLFPLQPLVWTALLLSMVVAWLSLVIVGHNTSHLNKVSHLSRALHLLFQHLRIFLRQDVRMKTCGRERMLVGGWMVVALVLTWSYSGTLVSLLAVRYVPQPLQTIRDVLDTRHVTVVLEEENSFLLNTLAKIKTGELKELYDLKYTGRIKYINQSPFREVLQQVLRGDHVLIDTTLTFNQYINNHFSTYRRCDLYLGQQTFFSALHCMIGQKGSPIVAALSHRIRRVVEAGLYYYWLYNSLPVYHHCRHSPSKLTVQEPLALGNLWGMLVMLATGHSLALMVFCLELCVVRAW